MNGVLALVGDLLVELGEEGEEAGVLPLQTLKEQLVALGNRQPIFVAVNEAETLVGALTLAESFAIYARGHYGVINEMVVAPEYRSTGVGTRLIHAAAEYGRSRGWVRLDVTAPESPRWQRTRQFYERLGFRLAGPKLKLMLTSPGDARRDDHG